MLRLLTPAALACALLAPLAAHAATPATLTVLSSGGIMGAIRESAPVYEKATGVT